MKTNINTGGEFYLADFGYFSMSVYRGEKIPSHTPITSPTEKKVPIGNMNQGRFISKPPWQFHATPPPYT
jgi:hypothetical protein